MSKYTPIISKGSSDANLAVLPVEQPAASNGHARDEQALSRYAPCWVSDLYKHQTPRYLLRDYLYEKQASLLVAVSGVGKSFLVLDWSVCTALGIPWHGHETEQAKTIYVAGEGAYSFAERLDACLRKYERSPQDVEGRLFFVEQAVPLLDREQVDLFIAAQRKALQDSATIPGKPGLVVFDTLSRCTAGIDENNNALMAQAISQAEYVRDALGASHVLIIHHRSDGDHAKKTGRGASSLNANVDATFSLVESNDVLTLTIENMRYGPTEVKEQMRRKVVPTSIWNEQEGRFQNSCVMAPLEEGVIHLVKLKDRPEKALSATARKLQKALPKDGSIKYTPWREKTGLSNSAFSDALRELKERQLVRKIGDEYARLEE